MQNFEHNRGSANVKFDPNDEKSEDTRDGILF